ncbi:lanthionine synthetase LanC family protein [Chryseobacterium sp. RLHN22]|uniref:lanthionine synthetase LanC family protein n=1 Tax=Chryseobacterium sp. RLHN22 TaxID=3437885 RepID=UPI003D9AC9C7
MVINRDAEGIISLCENEIAGNVVDYGVFTGHAGLALYYFEKYKTYKDELSLNKFEEQLEISLGSLNKSEVFSLCSGDIGVYFLILHLSKNNYFDEPVEDSFDGFPEYALDLINFYAVAKNFDYLHGFLGVLYLCLELYSSSKDLSFKTRLEITICHGIALLDSSAIVIDEEKIAWISKGYYSRVEGFSFGFAHGIPSIVSILTRALYLGFEVYKIKKLLQKSFNYIISVRGNYNEASFPNFITVADGKHISGETSRLAWCYGDLSVGVAMLNYGNIINNIEIVNEANEILLKTIERDHEHTGIVDVFLCHGSSGLVLIYNYLFDKTGISAYKDQANFWMNETASKIKESKTGLKTWLGKEGWIDQDTILEGKTGLLLLFYSLTNNECKTLLEKLFLINYED